MNKLITKLKKFFQDAFKGVKRDKFKPVCLLLSTIFIGIGLGSCLARQPTSASANDDNDYTIGKPQVVFKNYMFGWGDGMMVFDFFYDPLDGKVAFQDIFGNAYNLTSVERTDFIPYIIGDVQGNMLISLRVASVPSSPDFMALYDFASKVPVSWDIVDPNAHTLAVSFPVGADSLVIHITPRGAFSSANYGVVSSVDKAPNWTLDSLTRLANHYDGVGYNKGVNAKTPIQTLVGYVDDFLNIPLFGDTLRISNILQLGFGLVLLGFIIKIFLGG